MATDMPPSNDHEFVPDKKTWERKGLFWNKEEHMGLIRAAANACTDPSVGANMYKVQVARTIRGEFIKDFGRPEKAFKTIKEGAELDMRRWDGESDDAC